MRKEVIRMNALVAYFSATGTTAKAAKALANAIYRGIYASRPGVSPESGYCGRIGPAPGKL